MTYAVILSARMSSARLPGKALAYYCDKPNLAQIISRWKASRRNPTIIVATPAGPADDPIAALCASVGVPCYRGHNLTPLAQMDAALHTYAPEASIVARALGDNPLIDIGLADWRHDVLAETGADGLWYGGDHERITYAATTDIWSRAAWDVIVQESRPNDDPLKNEVEHPGLYMWRHIEKFSAVQLPFPAREYVDTHRTELDTPEDLAMLRAVFGAWKGLDILPTQWALDYLTAHPDTAALNARVEVKTQTAPEYARGNAWMCDSCNQRVGGIVLGNLIVRCARCGRPRKFYAQPPGKVNRNSP